MPGESPSGGLVLYVRRGCELCDEAADLLDATVGRGGYSTRDIEADDDLLLRYGGRIPVLAVDGIDRLEGLISGPELRELVSEREAQAGPGG